jgi:hypothetical protein
MGGEGQQAVYLKWNLLPLIVELDSPVLGGQNDSVNILCDDDLRHFLSLLFSRAVYRFTSRSSAKQAIFMNNEGV